MPFSVIHAISTLLFVNSAQSEVAFKCSNLKCWKIVKVPINDCCFDFLFELNECIPFQWWSLSLFFFSFSLTHFFHGQSSYVILCTFYSFTRTHLFAITLIYMLSFVLCENTSTWFVMPFVRFDAIVNDWWMMFFLLAFSFSFCLFGEKM